MILLLGGTRETAALARGLAEAGYRVLVSTATEISLTVDVHANISRRSRPLDEEALVLLLTEHNIRAIVDATHPYAARARATARQAAERAAIPYVTFIRPEGISKNSGVLFACDHEEAAETACSFGRPVFLTTGSRNLKPYVQKSREKGVNLLVRVLPEADSIRACSAAGIDEEFIVADRGPFSVETNREIMRRFGIGVLVTKDSGEPGGVREKLEAARLEGCYVVVIRRPEHSKDVFRNTSDLIAAVIARISKD